MQIYDYGWTHPGEYGVRMLLEMWQQFLSCSGGQNRDAVLFIWGETGIFSLSNVVNFVFVNGKLAAGIAGFCLEML